MFPREPGSSEIFCNTLSTTGTVITVPAGHLYSGTVSMSAALSSAGVSNPVVVVNGNNSAPAAGTAVCRLNLAGLALSTISDTIVTDIIVRAPEENDVTIDFTAGANGTSSVSINGWIN